MNVCPFNFLDMRRIIMLIGVLFLTSCWLMKDPYLQIEINEANSIRKFVKGESYHGVFTTTHPVVLTYLYYEEDDKTIDKKYISSTRYENPPYEYEWEGVRIEVHDFKSFEIWIDADCRPTEAVKSAFIFDLEPHRSLTYGDDSHVWGVGNLYVYRTNSPDEVIEPI